MPRPIKLHDFATPTDGRIAATVRALASGRDESVEYVALRCGMTRSQLYDRLNGTSPWKAAEIEALASHFGVEITELYDGMGGKFGPPSSPTRASSSTAELRTFNPKSAGAEVLVLRPRGQRRPRFTGAQRTVGRAV